MYQKILVPLDGSKLAEYALPHVKKIMKNSLARQVTIVRVFSVDYPELKNLHDHQGYAELKKSAISEAKKYLADIEDRLSAADINVNPVLIEGDRPATIVSDYAQSNGFDLIIMATRGYTGQIGTSPGTVKRTMLGSVALKILHEACVPVLLIKTDSWMDY